MMDVDLSDGWSVWALEAPADMVRLAGTFSAWNPTADPCILLLALVCLCLLD